MGGVTLRTGVTLGSLALLAVVPPLTGIMDAPFVLDIVMRMLCLAMAAISLNLILGYGGMISFGHAAYIGIGAYAVGIPAYYEIYSGFVQIPLAVGTAALFALITGFICLRTRGVHFIMITLAFAQMVFFTFVSIEEYGGDDGLVIDFKSEFFGWLDLEDPVTLYYVIFVCLVGTIYLVKRIVASRFGMVIQGGMGNEARMHALGYNVFLYRLICYVISGAICGLAGALLGNFTGFISPEMMDWTRSGELIFMVVLGGTGSLFGPVLGTAMFVVAEEYLSPLMNLFMPGSGVYWHILFGPFLILVVLFGRRGIDGLLDGRGRRDG